MHVALMILIDTATLTGCSKKILQTDENKIFLKRAPHRGSENSHKVIKYKTITGKPRFH